MALVDINNIIENHASSMDSKRISSKIQNYFENYFHSNTNVMITSIIKQLLWFNKDSTIIINDIIKTESVKYLIERRKIIRNNIKQHEFNISSCLNKVINDIKTKIDFLKVISNDSIYHFVKSFSSIILSDIYIQSVIEINVLELNVDRNKEIEETCKILKSISSHDNNSSYFWFLNFLGTAFKKKVLEKEPYPVPDNINRMIVFNETIKLYDNIKKYYGFSLDISNILYPLKLLLKNQFYKIIKYNTLDEITYIMNLDIVCKFFDTEAIVLDSAADIDNIADTLIMRMKDIKEDSISDTKMILDIYSFCSRMEITLGKRYIGSLYIKDNIIKIANIMNNVIINNTITNNTIANDLYYDINKVISILKNPSIDKDLFIIHYNKYLIRRLLTFINMDINNFTRHITYEKTIYKSFAILLGVKHLFVTNKLLNDTTDSWNNSNSNNNKIVSVITTSNYWDINFNEGILTKEVYMNQNTVLFNIIKDYANTFINNNMNKVINYYPHYGEVIVSYMDKDIKMLPVQFMILELFTNNKIVNYKTIITAPFLNSYNLTFIKDIIMSLVKGKLLTCNDNNYELKTSDFETDLINIFMVTMNQYIDTNIMNNLMHSRRDIVNTNINHTIKLNPLNKQELYNIIKDSIDVFNVTMEIFEDSLLYMIKSDYIVLNKDNKYEKIYY